MIEIPLPRRFGLAFTAIALGAAIFHGRVAEALVTRGDSFLQTGQTVRAEKYYERAVWWDRTSPVAADRYAFTAFQLRTPQALAAGVRVADEALRRSPRDARLLADRALCLQAAGEFGAARADFARAAELERDPRLLHFAGRAALRAGDVAAARRYWHAALHIDPSFEPAALALRKVGA